MVAVGILTKKLATIVLMAALSVADGVTTNRVHQEHVREINPAIRPFVGGAMVYPALQVDVVAASVLLLVRPKSRITKFVVPAVIAGHAAGLTSNVLVHQPEFYVVCVRTGPGGSGERCNWREK